MEAMPNRVELACGALEVSILPGLGGSIGRFDCRKGDRTIPVLRRAEGTPGSVLEAASFPLVPFSNRIRDGGFDFRGRKVRLRANMDGEPSPLHGQGWLGRWDVEAATPVSADLIFRHAPSEWPWAYEARQAFRLDPTGLDLRLSCRNLSDAPMPCGLGQHPHFPCDAETRLATAVVSAWTVDAQVLPVDKVPAVGRYDLADRLVCGQDLDNGFGGWGGTARITAPSLPFAIEMSSPNAGFFQLYSPGGGSLFVAEPVSHANAALNAPEEEWPELGLRVLAPGEEMSLDMRIKVLPVEQP